jgi:DNA-binding CsgD family transcriptional regulator
MDAAPLSLPMFLVTLENRGGSLGEAGEDLNGNQLALWACLTRSEQRVARLAGQGRRNAEIARLLNKSPMTVKKQLQSVYQKLDVTGRSRLIALLCSAKDAPIERGLDHSRYEQNHTLFPSLSRKLPTRWTSSQTTTGSEITTLRERR